MLTVSFTVNASAVMDSAMILLHFVSVTNDGMDSLWSVALSQGAGRLTLLRAQTSLGGWDYTRGVLDAASTQLADGIPHKIMLYKTSSADDASLELHIDGVLAARAPGSGDGIPKLISTSCVVDLRSAGSIQKCTKDGEMRWIDASGNTEGNCTVPNVNASSQVGCSGASGDSLYCTHECPERLAFNGTIHSLHVAHDVSDNNLVDHCAPCQPVCDHPSRPSTSSTLPN